MLKIPKKLYETNRLDNMAIVLNSGISNVTYGYGQNYGLTKKPWWKRLLA